MLPCCYCGKLYTKLSQHLETHWEQAEIKELKDATDAERKNIFRKLHLRGYEFHNKKVRDGKEGDFILQYRKKDEEHVKVIECPDCKACLRPRWIKQHRCSINKTEEDQENIRTRAKLAWTGLTEPVQKGLLGRLLRSLRFVWDLFCLIFNADTKNRRLF